MILKVGKIVIDGSDSDNLTGEGGVIVTGFEIDGVNSNLEALVIAMEYGIMYLVEARNAVVLRLQAQQSSNPAGKARLN